MFFSNMTIAAQQVVILYLLVAVGFAADRFGVFKQSTAKLSNDLLFYITTPVVVVQSFLKMEFSPETLGSLLKAFLCMAATLAVGIALALPFFNKDEKNKAVVKYAVSYGNMGYMALPLCDAMLGSEGVFYCSTGVVAFNMISFTHGVWLMTRGSDGKNKFDLKKLILNPGVISMLIGLLLFISRVKLPVIANSVLTNISNLNTPLAMIFLGTYIANTDLKSIFKDGRIFVTALLKLVVLPCVMFGVFKLIGLNGALITACMISCSAPSANNTVMFSAKYGKDTALASKIVAVSSLMSIITIPVMIALSNV